MTPVRLLRLEGLAVFLAATAAFVHLDGAWWLYVPIALAPDAGMAGYLVNDRVGSWTYNALHTYTPPIVVIAAGTASDVPLAVLVALVWTAHIGADRALGYGLKHPTGFSNTHLDA